MPEDSDDSSLSDSSDDRCWWCTVPFDVCPASFLQCDSCTLPLCMNCVGLKAVYRQLPIVRRGQCCACARVRAAAVSPERARAWVQTMMDATCTLVHVKDTEWDRQDDWTVWEVAVRVVDWRMRP